LLYEVLSEKAAGFRLEVLIVDPKKAAPRAKDVGLDVEEYREGIRAVLWTLGRWRNDGMSVEVKIYGDEPIWQMVLNEKEMWLLCARNTRSECSRIYCLLRDAPYGLHHGLYGVWERRWNGGDGVALTQLTPPDKNKIRDVRQKLTTTKAGG
jgi:hypothetical protein